MNLAIEFVNKMLDKLNTDELFYDLKLEVFFDEYMIRHSRYGWYGFIRCDKNPKFGLVGTSVDIDMRNYHLVDVAEFMTNAYRVFESQLKIRRDTVKL